MDILILEIVSKFDDNFKALIMKSNLTENVKYVAQTKTGAQ